jgi:hypothetical protein
MAALWMAGLEGAERGYQARRRKGGGDQKGSRSRMMSQIREDCGDKPRGETDHDVLDKRQEVGDPPEGLGGDVLV